MQISKTMLERYLYEEVEGVFKDVVDIYSLSNFKEDVSTVYENLKKLSEEINENVVREQVLTYLNDSVLWIESSSNDGKWSKTDISDILEYIERNKEYVDNSIMIGLVDIINLIGTKM